MNESVREKPQYGYDALARFASADKSIRDQQEAAHGYGCHSRSFSQALLKDMYLRKNLVRW